MIKAKILMTCLVAIILAPITVSADNYGSISNGFTFDVEDNNTLHTTNTNPDWGDMGAAINDSEINLVGGEGFGISHLPVYNFGEISANDLRNENIATDVGGSYHIKPMVNANQIATSTGYQTKYLRPFVQLVDQRAGKVADSQLNVSIRMSQPFTGSYTGDDSETSFDIQPGILLKADAGFDYTISGNMVVAGDTGHAIQFKSSWHGDLGAGPATTLNDSVTTMASGMSAASFGTITYEYGSLKGQINNPDSDNWATAGNIVGSSLFSQGDRVNNGFYLEIPKNITLKAKSYQAEYTWTMGDTPTGT